MAWQSILGIVIMVVSFIGVLIAAKKHMEPIAIVCAIIMLGGLGLYGWFYFNPPPDMSYQVYGKAVAQKIGEEVKKVGASKIVWVTSDASSEYSKACIEIFNAAAGANAEVISVMDNESGMFELNAKKLQEILKGCSAEDAVVLDASYMDGKAPDFFKGSYKGPKIFLTNNGGMMGINSKVFSNAFNKGFIVAAVASLDNIDVDFKPDEDDLDEAFSKRYVIVTKDNFEDNKAKFGME